KAVVKHVGNLLTFGVGGDLAMEVWDSWGRSADEQQRRAELEALACAPPAEAKAAAARLAQEEGATLPEPQRGQVADYLAQAPAVVRRSLRRPSDPTGRTVPPGLAPRRAEDLLGMLPPRLPRFRAGDRPLAGVDWELVELLGVGGFGEVWKAKNPLFDGVPPAALKFCIDPGAKEQLLQHGAAGLNQVMRHGH